MSLHAQDEMMDSSNSYPEESSNEPLVVFQNKGLLDIRCITTFGETVKEHDNPIGQFGTGLKYAIAILLRHDIEPIFHIVVDDYIFTKRIAEVRDKEFSIVKMRETAMLFNSELVKYVEA